MANPTTHLGMIQSFEQLLPYLEEELDWPLQQYEFEDLTFEYSPAELGLKEEDAVKVSRIHQLRPLQHGQPWGIFFVEFEKKKLPVVVLRRILSHLVVKKRASANRAGAAAWNLGDLLFISAFGEGATSQREIAFAHFHQETGDLPTLRVLGWDGADTPLKLNHVAATLREKLRWPDDPGNHMAWRETWSQAFRHRVGHIIRTADSLAEALAALARRIRGAALLLLSHESETGTLRTLHKAFQTALIHDLSEESFADTYAQTITYGLLTAAISRTDSSAGSYGTALIAENVADIVPVTNPFLKEMLQTFLRVGGRKGGIDFDELGIQDVVELLRGDETDLPAVLRDFGNKTQGEDPVIHFYEHFLAAYDKKLKVQRGVFYTPKPVVSYIVRSVHELLQTEFGLADGLADTTTWGEMLRRQPELKLPMVKVTKPGTTELVDQPIDPNTPFVQILDPATGTATFLVEVIEVIHRTLTAKWRQAELNTSQQQTAWNAYVPKHLLPRLHGYELMMAPYAIAHMKMGLKLFETGYRFGSQERVRIYLTNALEPANNLLLLAGITPALAHEAQAVNSIKQQRAFTVVIGNPPYSGHSANQMENDWIGLRNAYYFIDGKPLGERNPKWLQDDYVKLIRFGQQRLEQTKIGILAMITNHGYLDNPTFRGMRQNLLQTFEQIYILDLHGNAKKQEESPNGDKDENVFDIMQGVAIGIFLKLPILKNTLITSAKTYLYELFGLRKTKYRTLVEIVFKQTKFVEAKPQSPFYLFLPQNTVLLEEYEQASKITHILPINVLGFQTHRDNFAIEYDQQVLSERFAEMRSSEISDTEFRNKYNLSDNRDWYLSKARGLIRDNKNWRKDILLCGYRPFDSRYSYFSEVSMDYPRRELLNHVAHKTNLILGLGRQGKAVEANIWHLITCSKYPVDANMFRRGGINLFPLYLYPTKYELFDHYEYPLSKLGRYPNLKLEFVTHIEKRLDLQFITEGQGDLLCTFGPEDIFYYIYAVFHSPVYRNRYAEFLEIDFPRLPLTSSLEIFRSLVRLGSELVVLHLVEFMLENEPGILTNWPRYLRLAQFSGSNQVIENFPAADKVWQGGRVAINSSSGFVGVPEAVWNFHIGGYQVCHKWLKDRKGRALSDADILHYCKIVTALHETIRLMAEIDEAIDAHGGWPIQ